MKYIPSSPEEQEAYEMIKRLEKLSKVLKPISKMQKKTMKKYKKRNNKIMWFLVVTTVLWFSRNIWMNYMDILVSNSLTKARIMTYMKIVLVLLYLLACFLPGVLALFHVPSVLESIMEWKEIRVRKRYKDLFTGIPRHFQEYYTCKFAANAGMEALESGWVPNLSYCLEAGNDTARERLK